MVAGVDFWRGGHVWRYTLERSTPFDFVRFSRALDLNTKVEVRVLRLQVEVASRLASKKASEARCEFWRSKAIPSSAHRPPTARASGPGAQQLQVRSAASSRGACKQVTQ